MSHTFFCTHTRREMHVLLLLTPCVRGGGSYLSGLKASAKFMSFTFTSLFLCPKRTLEKKYRTKTNLCVSILDSKSSKAKKPQGKCVAERAKVIRLYQLLRTRCVSGAIATFVLVITFVRFLRSCNARKRATRDIEQSS